MAELLALRKHQLDTVEMAKDKPCWALFHDPGTGKTGSTVSLIRYHMNKQQRFLKVLIFVPPIGIQQWKREFVKFSKIEPSRVIPLMKSGKQRVKEFTSLCFEEKLGSQIPKGNVVVTNYESLLMQDLYQKFIDWGPDIIIADECHMVKSPSAQRSKLLDFLCNPQRGNLVIKKDKVIYGRRATTLPEPIKYLLTGTPATNSPMDLFMPFLIMDNGRTFGQNFYIFRNNYFYDKNAGMPTQRHFANWQLRLGALEEMNKLIFIKANYIKKEDCLDLPPLTSEIVYVEMGAKQKKIYEDMKRDLIATIDDKACVAQLAITKALRLQQMASGFVKTVEGDEIEIEDSPKIPALSQLLEMLVPTGKIIIWCAWQYNYKQVSELCKKLDIKYVSIVGGMTINQRKEAEVAFTKGDAQVMIANAKAAGMAVDLIEAPYAIYYSQTFSLIDAIQSRARNYRGGSEMHQKVVHYNIVTQGTIEELVVKKLESKEAMSLELLKQNILKI